MKRKAEIRSRKGTQGFTLIEVILTLIIIAILAGATVEVVRNNLDATKYEQTRNQLDNLKTALIGTDALDTSGHRTNFGYAGDWGSLPSALSSLTTAEVPAWTYDTYVGIGYGWKGPYISLPLTGQNVVNDAWGNAIVANTAVNPATFTSYGADGVAGGVLFNKDLILNIANSQWLAQVWGTVLDSNSHPATGYTIKLWYPLNGTETSSTLTTDATGSFNFPNIPMGVRSMYLTNASPVAAIGPRQITIDQNYFMVPTGFMSPSATAGGLLVLDAAKYNAVTFPATGCLAANQTWDDISGNSHNGTLTNFTSPCAVQPPGWTGAGTGASPYQLSFNNGTQYVANMGVGAAAFSDWSEIAWVNIPNSANGKSSGIVLTNRQVAGDISNTLGIGFYNGTANANGFVYFGLDSAAVCAPAIGTQNIADGVWHFIVGARANGTGITQVYVDDVLQNTVTNCGSTSASSADAWTLGYYYNGPHYFTGSVAYAAIYDRVLILSDIQTICNALLSRFTGAVCH